MARTVTGTDVLAICRSDHREGAGIDEMDFTRMARDIGFGDQAMQIFAELPKLSDGAVNSEGLAERVRTAHKGAVARPGTCDTQEAAHTVAALGFLHSRFMSTSPHVLYRTATVRWSTTNQVLTAINQ